MHTKNILNLFEELLYIIYDRHSEDMCAKYGRSRMNDAHTICPADFASLPAKYRMADSILFEKEIDFCMTFVLAISQLAWNLVTWKMS